MGKKMIGKGRLGRRHPKTVGEHQFKGGRTQRNPNAKLAGRKGIRTREKKNARCDEGKKPT